MAGITVTLPDGSPLELAEGATGADAAAAIGPRLAKDALAARVDGEVRDLAMPLPDGARIQVITPTSEGEDADAALWLVRHDAAHVMATAVLELWPETKVSIGPPIADGFYYDFEFPDGVAPSEDGSGADRGGDARPRRRRRDVRALRAAGRRGDRALPRRGASRTRSS